MKAKNYTQIRGMFMLAGLLSILAIAQATAQDKTVKGIVRFSEDYETAPGVNIHLKGALATGTYTDGNGEFVFPVGLNAGDVLVFSFIGRKTIEYTVPANVRDKVEIVMQPDAIEMVAEPLVTGDERPSFAARLFRRAKN